MRILFVNGNQNKGGDSIKMFRFKEELEMLGVKVDFTRASYGDWSKYDIIHSFNFTQKWTLDAYENAKKYKKPFVISSIFFAHEYGEQHKEMLKNSFLVCYSNKEVQSIYKASNILPTYFIITDGVDKKFYSTNTDRDIDFLFVGGVHVLKQPLKVARIAKKLGKSCTIVGGDHFQKSYWNECKETGATMTGQIPHENVVGLYARAKVVVQPSKFDAYPNTVIEGGLAGCSIVLTKETYCDLPVIWCDPKDDKSIEDAMVRSLETKFRLQEYINDNFKWNDKANKLKRYYEEILLLPK